MARAVASTTLWGMDIAEQTERRCVLALRAERQEPCLGEECPLWEDAGCALEQMAADGEFYVDAWPDESPAEL